MSGIWKNRLRKRQIEENYNDEGQKAEMAQGVHVHSPNVAKRRKINVAQKEILAKKKTSTEMQSPVKNLQAMQREERAKKRALLNNAEAEKRRLERLMVEKGFEQDRNEKKEKEEGGEQEGNGIESDGQKEDTDESQFYVEMNEGKSGEEHERVYDGDSVKSEDYDGDSVKSDDQLLHPVVAMAVLVEAPV